jgi:hypothetical protein
MRKSWLVCVLLGTLAWGQAAPSAPPPAQAPTQGMPGNARPPAPPPDTSASVPADAAVITVIGVCPPQPKPAAAKPTVPKPASVVTKTPAADCKTVITKAQFEKLASSVAPNVTPQVKKQLGGLLGQIIPMSEVAKKRGLDKTPQFAETVKFAKMQILTTELRQKIQADATNVPPADIESYYKNNTEAYEQFNLERLFVPRNKQMEAEAKEDEDKDQKLTEEQKEEQKKAKEAEEKAKTEEGEQAMTKLADNIRERAAAGGDFATLQKEAFEAAGMKITSPTVSLPKVRRTGLPQAHAAVFELKAGEVSQVINDSGGHYIYKVVAKEELSLDQVKEEIHGTLQNQRMRDMMEKVNSSFKVETNEAYFGPAAPGGMPPGRPNPRMAPGPMGSRPQAPSPQNSAPQNPEPKTAPQTPPPAQPPAAPPN